MALHSCYLSKLVEAGCAAGHIWIGVTGRDRVLVATMKSGAAAAGEEKPNNWQMATWRARSARGLLHTAAAVSGYEVARIAIN